MTDSADTQDAEDEETFAPEWVADGPGFDPAETYAAHLHKDYWWLIQKHEDEYLAVVYDRDEETNAHQAVVSKTTDGEWWASEQKIRSYKNKLCDADDVDVPESVLENELIAAHDDLQVETGDEVFSDDGADGFNGIEFGDPLKSEDLFERTEYVHEYRFGDETEFRVGLNRGDGETREIKIEWEEWQKEDGQSTKPAVKHKAETVLPNDEDVELPWPKWQKLKKAWKRVAEMKHEEAETEWEYQADSVVTQLFMQARVVSDRAAVMNSSSEPVAWYDSDHSGAVAPSDAKRKPIGDDEAVVWVRSEDVARVCRDLGIEMSGSEKRSKMTKLSEAFQRKGLTTRGSWKTKVSGHNVRLYPFKLSGIGVDEEDVVSGGVDEEITPSCAPVGDDGDDSDDDDGDDDDNASGDSASSTESTDSDGEDADDDGKDKADNGGDSDDEDDDDNSNDAESESSATESEDDVDAVDGDSADDTLETAGDNDDSNDEDDGGDDDVPTRSLPGGDETNADITAEDVNDDVLRTVVDVVEQEANGDGAVDETTVQAACARQHSTDLADVDQAVTALEEAGVLESVSDDETAPGEESVDTVLTGDEQA